VALQDAIDRVAAASKDTELVEVQRRLVVELDRTGRRPPSATWLDSVARDIAAGRRYVVSLESLGRPDLPPGGHEEAYDAPAHLSVALSGLDRPAGGLDRPPSARPEPVSRRRALFRLAGLLALVTGYLLVARRRRGQPQERRPGRGKEHRHGR
jgi:hypothetical protein